MPKVSRALILLGLSMVVVCYSQDLASKPSTATASTAVQEPTSVSYQNLETQEPLQSVAKDDTAKVDKATEPAVPPVPSPKKKQRKSARAIKQMELVPVSQTIEDFAKLRAEGERQHSKGVALQLVSAVMIPVGITMTVMNFDGYEDYGKGHKDGNRGAYALTLLGEALTMVGTMNIIIGASMRKNGTRKIRLAEEAEILSFMKRHNVLVMPVANFDNRAGGVVLASNF